MAQCQSQSRFSGVLAKLIWTRNGEAGMMSRTPARHLAESSLQPHIQATSPSPDSIQDTPSLPSPEPQASTSPAGYHVYEKYTAPPATMPPLQQQTQFSFFQEYFTKPVDPAKHPEKGRTHDDRRFSFGSIGFVVATIALVIMLLGIISAAVAVTLRRDHDPKTYDNYFHNMSPFRVALPVNFPDPAVWFDNGTWYAYATNNAAGVLPLKGTDAAQNTVEFGLANVQMATSTDFVHWGLVQLAKQPLPTIGTWARNRNRTMSGPRTSLSSTWAPGLIQRDDGKYVMYYSAHWNGTNPYLGVHPPPHCVGAAVSEGNSPAGPFTPLDEPLACPVLKGGAIDPEAFRDVNNTLYTMWKVDGNNVGHGGVCGNTVSPQQPTPIMIQKMQADGTTRDGEAIQILDRIDSDGPLVEAPMIVRSNEGVYFLFFSSGCTRSLSYAVKYATADHVTGPYTRSNATLLQTGDWGLEAPGSVGIYEDGAGGWNMAFHARINDGNVGRVRAMYTTKLVLNGTMASVARDNSTTDHPHGR